MRGWVGGWMDGCPFACVSVRLFVCALVCMLQCTHVAWQNSFTNVCVSGFPYVMRVRRHMQQLESRPERLCSCRDPAMSRSLEPRPGPSLAKESFPLSRRLLHAARSPATAGSNDVAEAGGVASFPCWGDVSRPGSEGYNLGKKRSVCSEL